jgi:hypothetical protein
MSADSRRILELLAEGKITVDEAAKLLSALRSDETAKAIGAPATAAERPAPQYLHIVAGAKTADAQEHLRIKIPLSLLRAGAKLRAFVPPEAREEITEKLRAKGLEVDPFDMTGAEIDDFLRALADFELEAGDEEGRLRLYVE